MARGNQDQITRKGYYFCLFRKVNNMKNGLTPMGKVSENQQFLKDAFKELDNKRKEVVEQNKNCFGVYTVDNRWMCIVN